MISGAMVTMLWKIGFKPHKYLWISIARILANVISLLDYKLHPIFLSILT